MKTKYLRLDRRVIIIWTTMSLLYNFPLIICVTTWKFVFFVIINNFMEKSRHLPLYFPNPYLRNSNMQRELFIFTCLLPYWETLRTHRKFWQMLWTITLNSYYRWKINLYAYYLMHPRSYCIVPEIVLILLLSGEVIFISIRKINLFV